MERRTQPLTLALGRLKGVFEAKTNIRKGYCQDSLPVKDQSHNGRKATCITETTKESDQGSSKDILELWKFGTRIWKDDIIGNDLSDDEVIWNRREGHRTIIHS